jgi:hypothetical protein
VELGWQPANLHHLDFPFTEDEIMAAVMAAPKEKALNPDGYIGIFFRMLGNYQA